MLGSHNRIRQLVSISFIFACLAASPSVADGKRLALIVGNGAYQNAPVLDNPRNDARAMAEELRNLGFDVILGLDTDAAALRSLVQTFGSRLAGADLSLFFYAGHGFQLQGRNFVVPTDANIREETDIEFEALDLDLVLRQMDRRARVKIVLLDACRNNPFETALTRSMGSARSTAALRRGLAPVQPAGGALIGFATDPGDIAYDGAGANSPFTTALLRHIGTPGLEINVMMTRVRADVFASTGERQRPWTTSSLIGEIYLNSADEGTGTEADIAAWKVADASGRPDRIKAYLAAFPNGLFHDLAELRLRELGEAAEQMALAQPQTAEPAPNQPGQAAQAGRFTDCADCPEMIVVPGGTFAMGEDFGPEWEKPRVLKTVSAPFAIGQTEVTRAQWAACAAQGGCRALPGPADQVPASGLTWEDAQAYVDWLSARTGRDYRLPTETEWEYAARSGSGTRYPTGPVLQQNDANFDRPEGAPLTVASYPPNAFGLYDLAGNVWEWVADCGAPYRQASSGSAAIVATPCIRVMRGGGFRSTAHELRSANRYFVRSEEGRDDYGLRVAVTVKPEGAAKP